MSEKNITSGQGSERGSYSKPDCFQFSSFFHPTLAAELRNLHIITPELHTTQKLGLSFHILPLKSVTWLQENPHDSHQGGLQSTSFGAGCQIQDQTVSFSDQLNFINNCTPPGEAAPCEIKIPANIWSTLTVLHSCFLHLCIPPVTLQTLIFAWVEGKEPNQLNIWVLLHCKCWLHRNYYWIQWKLLLMQHLENQIIYEAHIFIRKKKLANGSFSFSALWQSDINLGAKKMDVSVWT